MCDGRQSRWPWEIATKRQDIVNTIGLRKVCLLKKMRIDYTLGQKQEKIIMIAIPSNNNTSALERIVSNLSGVVGSLSNPAIQRQAAAVGFWEENNT